MLLCKEHDFNIIQDFKIGEFDEFSDHAYLYLSLQCNVKAEDPKTFQCVKYNWNNNFKDEFRNKVIGRLSMFNDITENIDIKSRDSVNEALDEFTKSFGNILRKRIKAKMI